MPITSREVCGLLPALPPRLNLPLLAAIIIIPKMWLIPEPITELTINDKRFRLQPGSVDLVRSNFAPTKSMEFATPDKAQPIIPWLQLDRVRN
jgi:hypothetical protein